MKYLSEKTGSFAVILSAVFFGMMPLFTKTAYSYGCNAYSAVFGRFLFGAAGAFIIIILIPGLSFRITKRGFGWIFILSILYSLTPTLLYSSYNTISTGLATSLHFTYPVVVMLIGTLFAKMKMQVRQWICLLICAAGIILLYKPGQQVALSGAILALLSGISYAFYILALGRSGLRSVHVITITFWISLLSAAELLIFSLASGKLALPNAWQGWAAFAGLGLVSTVLALTLFQIGVFSCGEVKTALLSTFEPITGVVIGVLVFSERLAPRVIAGIVLILISSVILVALPEKTKK